MMQRLSQIGFNRQILQKQKETDRGTAAAEGNKMMQEAQGQYEIALKAGQRYYKDAVTHGEYPYPLVLDDIVNEASIAGTVELGVVNIPTERIVGTKSAGRTAALAGNFMPLLDSNTEFGTKWISLCNAHLSDEGIRDPIRCYEFLGRFYVQEGNKRASVMMSYRAPSIPAVVARMIPKYSEDHEVQVYYEFMRFYALSRLYTVEFRHRGCYAKLQAALGLEEDHVWTEDERRRFSSGFTYFRNAFEKQNTKQEDVTPSEALLVWLQVFSFAEIGELTPAELEKRIATLWPDILASANKEAIELNTEPNDKEEGLFSRILGLGHAQKMNVAFLYAFSPEQIPWTKAHDEGRQYLEDHLGAQVNVKVYLAENRQYSAAIEQAIEEGAELIFATTAAMGPACRKAAALHKGVKILLCALFQPYTGVRLYNSRTYECKFITGAIAGAMADGNEIGYVANYPIFGTPASVNAFALGAKMTNPRAKIRLRWSCLPGDPVQQLLEEGINVISNREGAASGATDGRFELGTFFRSEKGELLPLAVPCWQWGKMYEKIIHSIYSGAWKDISASKAINYWWGIGSGVVDVQWSDQLPSGVCGLGKILKRGIAQGTIAPFRMKIIDQNGVLRNDGSADLTPEEILTMDWFCDNVEGQIPGFDEILPESQETVRALGLYRQSLLPETEEKQL